MSGLSWRWPLALAIGALLILALILLVLARTRQERLRKAARSDLGRADSGRADSRQAGSASEQGQSWPQLTAAEQTVTEATSKPVSERDDSQDDQSPSRVPLFWGLQASLRIGRQASQPVAARYRSYKLACLAGVSLIAASLLVSLGLVGRPGTVSAAQGAGPSRDIVLCLDVSGSALPYDRQVISTYLQLVKGFTNERIGMSIFNSTSRTVFPLTNDYSLVSGQLRDALRILGKVQTQKAIDSMSDAQYQKVADWLAGTQNRTDATSLIGDGLVSCAAMLPGFSVEPTAKPTSRSTPASILFASDNVLSGSPVYSLQAALDLAAKNQIRIDALFTGPTQSLGEPTAVDMRQQVEQGGGLFLTTATTGAGSQINQLVQSIEAEKARQADDDSRLNRVDNPAPWVGLLFVLIAAYSLVMGRVRR